MVKMDAVQKRLIAEVAGLHDVPMGAYNFRANSQLAGRNTTANIDIQSKKDGTGIDIFVKAGTKNESVHIPVVLSASGIKETVYNDFYIGEGADVHAFAEGRKLIIGGVDIPHYQGLDGHSDADVLAHAIMDALLSAARAGDIGKLFPPDDPAYEGADSIELLKHVAAHVRELGFEIIDVDSVIAAQAPKLSPHREQMRANLAAAMGIPVENVGVKATTTEHLGFEGREEGISATASCLLARCSN